MIRRISIGQFQLKQQDGDAPHLYLQGKPLHPIGARVTKLRATERKHIAEVAHWVKTFSPARGTYITANQTHDQVVESNLLTIYAELVRLNILTAYVNEQLTNNPEIKQYNYTSVHYSISDVTGEPSFKLKHFDKLPSTRGNLVEQVRYGAVLVFNPEVLNYIDLDVGVDLERLYGNYILAVKV